jgi:hypothetical protein
MMVLVPNDVLHPRRPDEHFAAEAQAAREAGHDVYLVDHDALTRPGGSRMAIAGVIGDGAAVYRGWMLSAEQYARFADALAARDVVMRTTAGDYARAHEFPGWYDAVREHTPRSVWTVGTDRADFDRACADLGPGSAVVRDHVKSMKHYWREAMFIPDVADADAAWAVACRLRELREDYFTGGFVLRRFEEFTGAEVRTWWVRGECRLVGAHPDTPDESATVDLAPFRHAITGLALPFVTVDVARRADGVWRIVEVGDGQVSDRPTTLAAADLISALV